MNNKNRKNATDIRSKNLKMFSIGSAILVFAIILVLNILLSATLENYLKLDLTPTSHNFICDETEKFLDSLPDGTVIKIVGLFDKSALEGNEVFPYVGPLLDDMQLRSDGKVEVSYVDPVEDPNILSKLDPNGTLILDSSVYIPYVVSCNGKVRLVDAFYDCFIYDTTLYQSGTAFPVSNIVEQTFVNNMKSVTLESTGKVYYLTGLHEDSHLFLDTIFGSYNMTIDEIAADDNFKVPSDCEILIIQNPDMDIPENVQEALKDYIKTGDKDFNLIVTCGINSDNIKEKFPHLNNVLHEFNIHIDDAWVVENDPSLVSGSDKGIFRGMLTSNYTDANKTGYVVHNLTRNLRPYSESSTSGVSEAVATSSESSALYWHNDDTQENASKCNIIMEGSYTRNVSVRAFVFGSSYFTCDDYFLTYATSQNDDNAVLIKSLLKTMISTENATDVPARPMADYSIDINKATQESLTAVNIIFLAVIPILCVTVAALVYHKRVHL